MRLTGLFVEIFPPDIDPNIFFQNFKSQASVSHKVCSFLIEINPMYLHRKLEDSELIDLLAIYTHRLTQIMIYGEAYLNEYDTCRRTIELIQNEVLCRRGFSINKVAYSKDFKQPPAA